MREERLFQLIQNCEGSTVVVVADLKMSYTKLCELNKETRNHNCGFIVALNFGLGGFIFVDFGDKFYARSKTDKKMELVPFKPIWKLE